MPGRRLSRWSVLLPLLAFLILPATLTAQEAPMAGGGGNGLVVYPLPSSDPTRSPNTGPYSASFWVVNTGLDEAVADFSCAVTGPVTCANVSPSSATISVGDSIAVGLSYSTLTGPGNGIITLTATREGATPPTSSGAKNVGVYPAGKGVVVLGNRNQDNLDRGLCLTVGAGEAAGLSCGDLITTAGLPAYRTLGRDRSL
ncbi:MAG: hypothetical protein SF070_18330 [Gemmatimonadota bacterium]|nr:hypothetical protein [Gemmatimonadota bacterium]